MTSNYSITIEIPTESVDPNRTLGVNRYSRHNLFKKIKVQIIAITYKNKPPKPLENFKLSITRHGVRALDYDNLIASFKSYIDGLKLAGIIKDDGWKYIRHINTNQVISTEKKLVITVEEI